MTETETTTPEETVQLLTLKLEAFKQRLSQIVTSYEEQDAERRVQITVLTTKVEQLENQIESLELQLVPSETSEVAAENDSDD